MKLFNDDCLRVFDTLQEDSVDLVLCDPPYGTTDCPWDSVIPLKEMWQGIERVIKKESAAVLLFGKNPFTAQLINSNLKHYAYDFIWHKATMSSPLCTNQRPAAVFEIISFFRYGKSKYNPLKTRRSKNERKVKFKTAKSRHKILNKRPEGTTYRGARRDLKTTGYNPYQVQTNFLKIPRKVHAGHPTEKPTKLLYLLIQMYSKKEDTVLDFCMGSGSTGVAALAARRNFIGVELNKEVFLKAKRRIATYENGLDRN